MWIATHSGAWFPTLIEIESPGKRIFNKDGSTTAAFTRARNQLERWRAWFNNPINVQQFIQFYGIPDRLRLRMRRLHMILIYGRRSEFKGNPKLTYQRGSLLIGADEELMSYDRLKPDTSMSDAITVKAVGQGKFQALRVLSVFSTGPQQAERLLHIDGVSKAIDRNQEIQQDRRDFIKRRIDYWREWASASNTAGFYTGHRE